MIKSERSSSGQPTIRSACFVERDSSLGISFETNSDRKRFALNSFLTVVDYAGTDELVFRYTSCTITVRGQALDPTWNAVCSGSLARIIVCPNQNQVHSETIVASITIEDDSDPLEDPALPTGAAGKFSAE